MSGTGMMPGVAGPSPSEPADTRPSRAARAFLNAQVFPMGDPVDGKPAWEQRAQAILWSGDTIELVGSDAEVRAEAQRRGIVPEDLGGRVVLPGFVDAHTHFLHVGVKRTRPDLRGATDRAQALRRVQEFLVAHPGAHPVIGEGWDESEWPDAKRPTRQDLDTVVREAAAADPSGRSPPDRPLVLRRICGHIAVASTSALPRIRSRWDDPAAVDLDTGLLLEAPSLYLNEVLPSSPAELDAAVQHACAEAHRLGVTTVGDYSQAPYRMALQRAAARGTLSVRVASSIYVQQLGDELAAGFRTGRPAVAPDDMEAQGPAVPKGDTHRGVAPGVDSGDRVAGGSSPWMRDGGLKVFLDGSLGAHTAHLREPYLDLQAGRPSAHGTAVDPHAGHDHAQGDGGGPDPSRGSRIWTDGELDAFFARAHGAGVQLHVHAIGDAAVDQGLDAFARLAAHEGMEGRGWDAGPTGLRHRFEHYEIVHDDQVARTAALGIVSSSQPNFVGEWSAKGGMYEARLGDRYKLNNRFQAFLSAGIPLAFGSDGMPFGPLVGLRSAIGHPDPTQRLGIAQAIWHYTTAAAWSLHWEDAVGALRPGLKADLVVLDRMDLDGDPTQWTIWKLVCGGRERDAAPAPADLL